jgi:hypothetical protein
LYEISSFDSQPGSINRNGDGSDADEDELLQRQRMLQHGLLQEIAA